MEDVILNAISKWNMISDNDKIILALSGGADSVALLHFLSSAGAARGLRITAVHINHGLRGEESDLDESYSRSLSESLGIPFIAFRHDVEAESKRLRISCEEAGRRIRYDCLERERLRQNADKIAVAHTKNDQAETILYNLFRGAGAQGLRGIPPVRGRIIRPLIYCSRSDIEEYCRKHSLNFCVDSTNLTTDYTRNKIRLKLIPYIRREINPAVVDALSKSGSLIYEDDSYLNDAAKDIMTKSLISPGEIDLNILSSVPDCLARRVLRMAYAGTAGNLKDLSLAHVEALLALAKGPTGKQTALPGGITAQKNYSRLCFYLNKQKTKDFCYNLVYNEWVYADDYQQYIIMTNDIERINLPGCVFSVFSREAGDMPLQFRTRRPGDRIYFSSIGGHKTLKDFFIDKKIPRDIRNSLPLLAHGSEILWIPSLGVVSDKYTRNGGLYVGIGRGNDIQRKD